MLELKASLESGAAPIGREPDRGDQVGQPSQRRHNEGPDYELAHAPPRPKQFRRFDHADRTSDDHGQEWQDRQCVGRCEATPAR